MSAFLEFKGNPYPPLQPVERKNPKWLINVLLQGAQQDFHDSGLAGKINPIITNDRSMDGLTGGVFGIELSPSTEDADLNLGIPKDGDGNNDEGTPV